MVLKNCGPKGYPGMSEVGNMGFPPKVLWRGITDSREEAPLSGRIKAQGAARMPASAVVQ